MSALRRGAALFALAGTSVAATLGAFEVVTRWLGYEPIYAVYSHPEVFWQKDALLGWSHEPNSEGTYVGPRPWPVEFETPVHINSLGLRGPELGVRPEDGYRVMVLGDSMVAAFEVRYEETFTALLEAGLRREFDFPVEVINAGVRGYGTDQSYLYYKERGRRLRPDLVVFIHGGNDPADNITLHRMRRIFSKGALALRPDGTLEPTGYPIPDYPLCSEVLVDRSYQPRRVDRPRESAICRAQTLLADRSALFTLLSNRIRESPELLLNLYKLGSPFWGAEAGRARGGAALVGDRAALEAPRYELTAAILLALARQVPEDGADLVLPVIPVFWAHLDSERLWSEGVTTFRIDEDLNRRELTYEHDSHLNPKGHELFARLLAPVVAQRIRERRAREHVAIAD